MTDARRDFAREHGGHEFIAARFMKDKRRARNKLAASGQQNNVLQKFQRPGAAAILIIDFAVHMIRVSQVNELCTGLKVAVIPSSEPQTTRSARFRFRYFVQIQKHELARVQPKAAIEQRGIHGAAEGHELRFDAHEMRDRAHRVQHFFEQPAPQSFLCKFAGDVQATDKAFLFFKDVEGIARGHTVFERHAARKRASFHEALDEFERAAIIPMQFITPVQGFFFK